MIDDNILMENAILAFLHHYPDHRWSVPYAELLTRIRDEQRNPLAVQRRGRKATRQRKKTTSSNTSSKEANKTIKT